MPIKKYQHFIPRFYLKHFSNEGKKTIGVLNIKKEIFISSSSIKHQACSPYFYGKDRKVEDNLSIIEAIFANIISKILELKKLPNHNSEEHILLLIFIISLISRTEYAAESINEAIDKMYKIIYKEDPRVKDYLRNVKIGVEHPGTYSLGNALKCVPVAFDLEFKLLNNITKTVFLTSDNPVVKYNQFLELKKAYGGITGLGSKGLQIMLPLSPFIYIIFYDQGVYKIGNRKQRVIDISNIKDIDELNLLQFINANENIYFNKNINQNYVDILLKRGKKYRRERKVNVKEFFSDRQINNEKSSLVVTHSEDIKISLYLSFINIIKKARKYELGNKVVHIRNERVSRVYDLITKKDKILYRENRG